MEEGLRRIDAQSNAKPEQDFVIKTIENRDVHFLRCWFSDVLGNMKSFAIVPGEIENALVNGMGFDGSSIRGFSATQDSDMLAFPDPSKFQVLPWRPESNAVARMFCDMRKPNGLPFEADPRHILKRAIQRAADAGFVLNIGTEIEYFYFKDQSAPEPLDFGTSFDLTSLDYASDLRRDTILTLEKMGIPIEYSHHESGPSQHEIDLRYTDALSMADSVMTYKLVVKEIAMKHGVFASFMPKPIEGVPGNGMHIHMSLFDEDGRNVFFDEGDPSGYNLSVTAKRFIAGILAHAKEFCLLTNQYVNSYKRLCSGMNAPSSIAWARHNRSTMVRIPGYRPDSEDACRVELRNPDPAANPYLVFSAMLAAGLDGIEKEMELCEPQEDHDFFKMTPEEMAALGVESLPRTLGEAVKEFEASELMRDAIGAHVHEYLVETKLADWRSYQQIVTPWELERNLAVL